MAAPGYGVELYHDRIGETLASLLDENERRQIHRRLAQAIEARGLDDPESLYEDYLGAGEKDRAVLHAQTAAQKAAGTLAFDRAALYYRRAIDLKPDATNVVELKIGLGDALANAGRPAEAAAEFLEAAKTTSAAARSRTAATRGRAIADGRAYRGRAGSLSSRARSGRIETGERTKTGAGLAGDAPVVDSLARSSFQ